MDYTKCLGENTTRHTNEKIGRQDPSTIKRNENASMDYTTFVNTVGKEKVEKFRRMNYTISQENNEEFSRYSFSGNIFKKTEITQ